MSKRHRHVTKREAEAVAAYATDVCGALHLPRWRILVMEDPCDSEAMAEVDRVDGKWTARIWLASDWMTRTSDERRETITHEICHLLHARLSDAVVDDARPLMRAADHDDWARRCTREFELMVDHLALFLTETHGLERAWDNAHGKAT